MSAFTDVTRVLAQRHGGQTCGWLHCGVACSRILTALRARPLPWAEMLSTVRQQGFAAGADGEQMVQHALQSLLDSHAVEWHFMPFPGDCTGLGLGMRILRIVASDEQQQQQQQRDERPIEPPAPSDQAARASDLHEMVALCSIGGGDGGGGGARPLDASAIPRTKVVALVDGGSVPGAFASRSYRRAAAGDGCTFVVFGNGDVQRSIGSALGADEAPVVAPSEVGALRDSAVAWVVCDVRNGIAAAMSACCGAIVEAHRSEPHAALAIVVASTSLHVAPLASLYAASVRWARDAPTMDSIVDEMLTPSRPRR